MRRVARFTRLSIVLLLPLLSGFAWGQYIGVPGPGPVAPAPDSPAYSVPSGETLEPSPPSIHAEDIWKAEQDTASDISVAPDNVQIDQGASGDAFTIRASFNGIDMTLGSGAFAADPTIGVGPAHLILGTNDSVAIQDKTGTLMASINLRTFFSSVKRQGQSVFDPRVFFDPGSNRFFIAAVGDIRNPCASGACVSDFFLAVSKTSSPTTLGSGDWYFYAFDATLDGATPTTNFADFTGLGADDTVVVLTAKMVSLNDGSFQTLKIRILDKSKLTRGEAVTWTDFVGITDPSDGLLARGAFQPALHFGSPGIFFLVNPSNGVPCALVVWGITNLLSSPTLSNRVATATGNTCGSPPDALQPGGGASLDTGSNGLQSLIMYRNGSLWAAQTIAKNFGSGSVAAIRWVQIDVSTWPHSVSFIQDSTFGADRIWYFYPAIWVDASNNVAIVFARSSATEFASVYYAGRLAIDPLNTLRPSVLLKAGTATLNQIPDSGRGGIFYGDYSGIALDPNDGSFWMLGEYAKAPDQWGTWVGQLALRPFSGWAALPGGGATPAGPAVVIFNGAPQVFVRGTNSRIYQNFLTAGSWSGWSEVPGGGFTPSGPRATVFNNTLYLFVRGTNDHIYQNLLMAGGWSGWSEVPGGGFTPSSPGATVFSNTLYLFVRGTNDRIYQNLLTAGGWSGWSEVPGGGATSAGPAAAVFQNFLYLTVQGTNNRLYDNLLTSVGWTGWAAVPGNLLTPSGPAATVFNGELWYVVRGTDDRIYRNRLPAVAASDWTGWVEVLLGGGFTPSGPGAAATASTLYLVVRGEDNGIYLNQATLP